MQEQTKQAAFKISSLVFSNHLHSCSGKIRTKIKIKSNKTELHQLTNYMMHLCVSMLVLQKAWVVPTEHSET